MQKTKTDTSLRVCSSKGESTRVGRSIVPVQTLIHGSMPPTPAKIGVGKDSGGVHYQLHDDTGVALRGESGSSEIEIAFERVEQR